MRKCVYPKYKSSTGFEDADVCRSGVTAQLALNGTFIATHGRPLHFQGLDAKPANIAGNALMDWFRFLYAPSKKMSQSTRAVRIGRTVNRGMKDVMHVWHETNSGCSGLDAMACMPWGTLVLFRRSCISYQVSINHISGYICPWRRTTPEVC